MAAIVYATVGSNDLARAMAFYDELLATAGFRGMFEHMSGGRIYGDGTKIAFAVLGPYNGEPATVGNGAMAGFRFQTPEEVHAFHAKALALGATCEGPPGERVPDMHFAYFRDLDGNKICAFAFTRVDSEALHDLTVAMGKS